MDTQISSAAAEIFRFLYRQIRSWETPRTSDYEALLFRHFPAENDEHARKRHATRNIVEAALDALMDDSDAPLFSIDAELCDCDPDDEGCRDACVVDAIIFDEDGNAEIDSDLCVDCAWCYHICDSGAISTSSHVLRLAQYMQKRGKHPVYAIVAPSFAGQFEGLNFVHLKAHLLAMGFEDVWEVALGADLLTLREADQFVSMWKSGRKFMISSCCCPAFIKLVERHASDLSQLISDSVSPMIAMGRLLKKMQPASKVVFIGPCLAKRGEINRDDLSGAVDAVITFSELDEVLRAERINLHPIKNRDVHTRDASHDGRIYAYSGGVSRAIVTAIREKLPDREIHTIRGNGIKDCGRLLEYIAEGDVDAHFMEGMACPGGCVAGPGTNVSASKAEKEVDIFARKAPKRHSHENEVAEKFISHLGEEEIESILHSEKLGELTSVRSKDYE